MTAEWDEENKRVDDARHKLGDVGSMSYRVKGLFDVHDKVHEKEEKMLVSLAEWVEGVCVWEREWARVSASVWVRARVKSSM